jgi:hypothetical protein
MIYKNLKYKQSKLLRREQAGINNQLSQLLVKKKPNKDKWLHILHSPREKEDLIAIKHGTEIIQLLKVYLKSIY